MFKAKRCLLTILALAFFVTTIVPSGVLATADSQVEVVFESNIDNKVIEVSNEEETVYIVTSKPIIYNDLSDQKVIDTADTEGNEIIGKRVYFHITNDLTEAMDVANQNPEEKGDTSIQGDFWNGSFIEDTYHLIYGSGEHLYLSAADYDSIKAGGAFWGEAMGTAILSTLGINPVAAAVIAGGAVVAAYIYANSIANPDGSFDLWRYYGDAPDDDDGCIDSGQDLGTYRVGSGDWLNLSWPSNWSGFCL